jgi:hypothetical protein
MTSRAPHSPPKWPMMNSRAVPTRPRVGDAPRLPPTETRPERPWWTYALVGGLTLVIGGLALLMVTVGNGPAHTAATTATHHTPHHPTGNLGRPH